MPQLDLAAIEDLKGQPAPQCMTPYDPDECYLWSKRPEACTACVDHGLLERAAFVDRVYAGEQDAPGAAFDLGGEA